MKGPLIIALLALLGGYLYPSIKLRLTVLGVFRNPTVLTTLQEGDLVKIEDTVQCEDLHYYEPAKVLFTACQDSPAGRFIWFPPLATFDTPLFTQGSIHVIDPKTFKSKRLAFENFKDPFFSHGIDVLTDPEDTGAVYIFAISHPPNPDYPESSHEHAASRVEIFRHVLGSETIKHLRTVRSELINTPNDIYAESPTSFFVTDDHYYRDGILRSIEDIFPSAKWSSTRHVQVLDLHSSNATGGITVTTALSDLHSQNGLGHGQTPDDILLIGASTGVLYRTKKTGTASNPTLTPIETIQLDSSLDNPSFFSDPYATATTTRVATSSPDLEEPSIWLTTNWTLMPQTASWSGMCGQGKVIRSGTFGYFTKTMVPLSALLRLVFLFPLIQSWKKVRRKRGFSQRGSCH